MQDDTQENVVSDINESSQATTETDRPRCKHKQLDHLVSYKERFNKH